VVWWRLERVTELALAGWLAGRESRGYDHMDQSSMAPNGEIENLKRRHAVVNRSDSLRYRERGRKEDVKWHDKKEWLARSIVQDMKDTYLGSREAGIPPTYLLGLGYRYKTKLPRCVRRRYHPQPTEEARPHDSVRSVDLVIWEPDSFRESRDGLCKYQTSDLLVTLDNGSVCLRR